ncbi:hypothetical protein Tco_0483581 [Tanacetum coccineum]
MNLTKKRFHLILTGIGDENPTQLLMLVRLAKKCGKPSEVSTAQKDIDMQKNLALIAKYFMGMQKAKGFRDSCYHKEKMLLCKQAEKGVHLSRDNLTGLQTRMREIDEQ